MSVDCAMLRGFAPQHDCFVGIDSDGCVFDTMAVKQREHFHPLIIKHWHLERCADALIACADFSNLISCYRGSNRFPALLRTFTWFRNYPGVAESGVELPKLDALRAYVQSGLTLGNPSLRTEVERTGDPELRRLLEWSLEVSASIDGNMRPVPPFPEAVATMEQMRGTADLMVVSQTPEAALRREWKLHRIDGLVEIICGQEAGTKAEMLAAAAGGKYASGKVLMVGDAQGDLRSAREAGALFFPITPGDENNAWRRLREEGFPRLMNGTFAGDYETELKREFLGTLPSIPPWEE